MSIEAVSSTVPSDVTDVVGWRREAIARLQAGNVELPMVPVVATKVVGLVQGGDVSVRDLVDLIQKDQVVASSLLRTANSALYGANREIRDLGQAIMRMGFSEVRNIVVSITLRSATSDPRVYGDRGPVLHQHSIGAAYAARLVADRIGTDEQEAFLAGLFHDLGKLVLLKITWELEQEWKQAPPPGAVDLILEHYHAPAGALTLSHWGLGGPIEEAVQVHHEPELARRNPKLAQLTHVADRFCHRLGLGCEPEEAELATESTFEELGLDEEWVENTLERLPGMAEVASQVFSG